MGILDHYPAEKRWWRPDRCVCGLRLRNCPDWRQRTAKPVVDELRAMYRQLTDRFTDEVPLEERLAAVRKGAAS